MISLDHLSQLYPHFIGQQNLPISETKMPAEKNNLASYGDLSDVVGQPLAKRALKLLPQVIIIYSLLARPARGKLCWRAAYPVFCRK